MHHDPIYMYACSLRPTLCTMPACHLHTCPPALCLQVICHGIPDERELVSGDIINVDVTVFLNGYHGDLNEASSLGSLCYSLCDVCPGAMLAIKRVAKLKPRGTQRGSPTAPKCSFLAQASHHMPQVKCMPPKRSHCYSRCPECPSSLAHRTLTPPLLTPGLVLVAVPAYVSSCTAWHHLTKKCSVMPNVVTLWPSLLSVHA